MPSDLLEQYSASGDIELAICPSSDGPSRRQWLLNHVAGASGLVVFLGDKVDEELLNAAGPSLRCVSTMSVGYDHCDTDALRKRRIRLGTTPNVLNAAVADLALMLTLMTMRQVPLAVPVVQQGTWSDHPWSPLGFCGPSLGGKTIGFYGFGAIAQTVALRLVPFHPAHILYTTSKPKPFDPQGNSAFHVLATGEDDDPLPSGRLYRPLPFPYRDIPVENCTLEEMLPQVDVLYVLASFNPSTKHTINASVFANMKRSAVVINASRGGLVKTEDLVDALRKGIIAGAGLDVLEGEPSESAFPQSSSSNSADTSCPLSHQFRYPRFASTAVRARGARESRPASTYR